MTKFFFKFKNPNFGLFLANFPNFWGKKSFSKKSDGHAQLHKGFWQHAKTQRNLMIQFQENTPKLLYRVLLATARGPTSKIAVD